MRVAPLDVRDLIEEPDVLIVDLIEAARLHQKVIQVKKEINWDDIESNATENPHSTHFNISISVESPSRTDYASDDEPISGYDENSEIDSSYETPESDYDVSFILSPERDELHSSESLFVPNRESNASSSKLSTCVSSTMIDNSSPKVDNRNVDESVNHSLNITPKRHRDTCSTVSTENSHCSPSAGTSRLLLNSPNSCRNLNPSLPPADFVCSSVKDKAKSEPSIHVRTVDNLMNHFSVVIPKLPDKVKQGKVTASPTSLLPPLPDISNPSLYSLSPGQPMSTCTPGGECCLCAGCQHIYFPCGCAAPNRQYTFCSDCAPSDQLAITCPCCCHVNSMGGNGIHPVCRPHENDKHCTSVGALPTPDCSHVSPLQRVKRKYKEVELNFSHRQLSKRHCM